MLALRALALFDQGSLATRSLTITASLRARLVWLGLSLRSCGPRRSACRFAPMGLALRSAFAPVAALSGFPSLFWPHFAGLASRYARSAQARPVRCAHLGLAEVALATRSLVSLAWLALRALAFTARLGLALATRSLRSLALRALGWGTRLATRSAVLARRYARLARGWRSLLARLVRDRRSAAGPLATRSLVRHCRCCHHKSTITSLRRPCRGRSVSPLHHDRRARRGAVAYGVGTLRVRASRAR